MQDILLARGSLAVAYRSYKNGNLPFGCLLADAEGNILLEAENTVHTHKDAIAHCEINLVHLLAGVYDASFLERCTVYASTEPCPMCTGAIFWSGIGRIVYALDKSTYHDIAHTPKHVYQLNMTCSEMAERSGRALTVQGPVIRDEAIAFYESLSALVLHRA